MRSGFLKLVYSKDRELRGGSVDPLYTGWIDVENYSFVPSQMGSSSRQGGADNPEIVITKYLDISTSSIMSAAATGYYFETGVLEILPQANTPGVTFRFDDVRITHFFVRGSDDTGRPLEEFQFSYARIGHAMVPGARAVPTSGAAAAMTNAPAAALAKSSWALERRARSLV